MRYRKTSRSKQSKYQKAKVIFKTHNRIYHMKRKKSNDELKIGTRDISTQTEYISPIEGEEEGADTLFGLGSKEINMEELAKFLERNKDSIQELTEKMAAKKKQPAKPLKDDQRTKGQSAGESTLDARQELTEHNAVAKPKSLELRKEETVEDTKGGEHKEFKEDSKQEKVCKVGVQGQYEKDIKGEDKGSIKKEAPEEHAERKNVVHPKVKLQKGEESSLGRDASERRAQSVENINTTKFGSENMQKHFNT